MKNTWRWQPLLILVWGALLVELVTDWLFQRGVLDEASRVPGCHEFHHQSNSPLSNLVPRKQTSGFCVYAMALLDSRYVNLGRLYRLIAALEFQSITIDIHSFSDITCRGSLLPLSSVPVHSALLLCLLSIFLRPVHHDESR